MGQRIVLRDRVVTIGPNEEQDYPLSGNVLRVTAGAVPLSIKNREGNLDFYLEAGERAEFADMNHSLVLSHKSGVAQNFTLSVGIGANVASAKISGSVTISGTPTVINGGGTLTDITNTVKVDEQGFSYGASWKSNTAQGAGGVDTIFTPAANVNGAIILAASFCAFTAAALPKPAFLSKTSAPASNIDGDVILMPKWGGGYVANGELQRAVKIPAGRGLYYTTSVTEDHGMRSVLYRLL